MSDVCANCGATLAGAYCHACGQKRLNDSDRHFGHLLRQFFEAATDLDGRFWGSLKALLFRPGLLSRDYIEGRRTRWLSPITLFLLINLAYFFAAPQSDFAAPFEWSVPGRIRILSQEPGTLDPVEAERLRTVGGPWYGRLTAAMVERRVEARDADAKAASAGDRGYDYRDYREAYNAKVPETSKALAILHVPFLAAVLMLLFRRQRLYYADHFVVALHLVAFNMALLQPVVHAMDLLHTFVPPTDLHNRIGNWFIRIVMTVYTVIALRRSYSAGWPWSAGATISLFIAYILINVCVYRPALFLIVFALT